MSNFHPEWRLKCCDKARSGASDYQEPIVYEMWPDVKLNKSSCLYDWHCVTKVVFKQNQFGRFEFLHKQTFSN